ncbi:MAG: hypothetical protein AAGE01_18310 [Pseudomonadota bacterium]
MSRRNPSQHSGARHVEAYVHLDRIGVLVELESVDDFSCRTEEFRELARDLAIHIAAMAPVGIERVALDEIGRWLPVAPEAAAVPEGTPDSLLEQPFVRDDRITVAQRIARTEEALGVAIRVRRFVRFDADES